MGLLHTRGIEYVVDPTWVWVCVTIAAVLVVVEGGAEVGEWIRRRRKK